MTPDSGLNIEQTVGQAILNTGLYKNYTYWALK